MIFNGGEHPVSKECSSGDYFSVKKSSCFRRMLSQGCFSRAEFILIQRNALPGMLFHRRKHPVSEKSSLRDDFPQQKSSCFERMLFWGLLFSEEIILFQRNPLSGMIFHRRKHPDSEESSSRDVFPWKKSS